MKAKTFKIISFSVSGFLVAVFLALTIACGVMADMVTSFLCGYNVDTGAMDAARLESEELAQQIVGEGAVLVQNNNSVLPLSKTASAKVNVFGWSSTQWVASGTGSGQSMNASGNAVAQTGIYDALTEYGIEYNASLKSMYENYLGERPYFTKGALSSWNYQFSRLYEPSISDASNYSQALLDSTKSYSDTAIVVIGRVSGESNDLPKTQYKGVYNATIHANGTDNKDTTRTYLEISTEEEEMLKYVGANFDKVVVLINSTNTMELGFMETIDGLDSCLIVGGTGQNAVKAVPKLIYGDINPSGHTVDTYAYALESSSTYANSGGTEGENYYTNASDDLYPLIVTNGNVGDNSTPYDGVAYVDYAESIYVGYKWFETADTEGYWNNVSNQYGQGYDGIVQYPFGYGMSYTNFSWEIVELSHSENATLTKNDEVKVVVRVVNEGNVAGQDVVQLYYTPQYNAGQIEKASINLASYAKTQVLEPGQYQDLTLTIKVEDMASYDVYDSNKNGYVGYEIDAGVYSLKLMKNSHDASTVLVTANSAFSNYEIKYNISENIRYETDSVTSVAVTNKLTGNSSLDGISIDGSDSNGNINFMKRNNFSGTFPSSLAPARAMTQNLIDTNLYTEQMSNDWINQNDTAIITGANNGHVVYDENGITELGLALGADYNESRWDAVMNQVTISEMTTMVVNGYGCTSAIASIGKPRLNDIDGPCQMGSFGMAQYMGKIGTGFPAATVLAQTWSTNLAYDYGLAIGKEGNVLGYSGWYGPGVNLHRSPFGGRNWEYYSEDSYLSGIMAVNTIRATKNTGIYCYLKHLALYELEWNRDSIYTWITEQTLRETYLKPFKMADRKSVA